MKTYTRDGIWPHVENERLLVCWLDNVPPLPEES
jgi:hypothetical protein